MKLKHIFVFLLLVILLVCGYDISQYEPSSTTSKHVSKPVTNKKNSKSVSSSSSSQNSRVQAVQTILNQYEHQDNIGVVYVDLSSNTSASINANKSFYAASVAKLPVVAYVQQSVKNNTISWNSTFPYNAAANNIPNAMVSGGTGTLQNENHQGKSYSTTDLLQRTIEQSDNQASNQLLYHVAMTHQSDFNAYLKKQMGISSYSKTMTASQASHAMLTVWNQHQKASEWLQHTDWAHNKIGTLPVPVAHKIGINGAANNDTAIFLSNHRFALTIMTDGWSDSQIATLAQRIYQATEK